MWVYSSVNECEKPIRIFEYQLRRSGNYPKEYLQENTIGRQN